MIIPFPILGHPTIHGSNNLIKQLLGQLLNPLLMMKIKFGGLEKLRECKKKTDGNELTRRTENLDF
jgi:hypothetical protein